MELEIFVAALAGYWFLRSTSLTRARIERLSGYHFLFQTALIGFGLWVLSRELALVLGWLIPDLSTTYSVLKKIAPSIDPEVTFSIGILCVILLLVPRIINKYTDEEKLARTLVEQDGNMLEWTAQEAMGRGSLLELTLQSGKTYIGFVLDRWAVSGENACVALVPVLSGYRDKETHELVITTNYASILREIGASVDDDSTESSFPHLSVKDLQIVLPSREIASARLFDMGVHDHFLKSAQTRGAAEADEE